MRIVACLLLLLAAATGQIPSVPQNLSVSIAATNDFPIGATIVLQIATGTNNPLGLPLVQGAFWQMPDMPVRGFGGALSNVWAPECSYDGGVTWQRCGNQGSMLPPRSVRTNNEWCMECWAWTETGSSPTNWMVRIKKIQ